MLGLSPLAGAVATGNTVVLKPSEIGTAAETVLAELIPQYLDPHAVRVVTGGPDVVHEMINAKPDYVFFTGSPTVGKKIAQACSTHLIEYIGTWWSVPDLRPPRRRSSNCCIPNSLG